MQYTSNRSTVTGCRETMLNLLNLFSFKRLPLLTFWTSFISCTFMSCDFMFRNFMTCHLVRHFHVLHFHVRPFQRPLIRLRSKHCVHTLYMHYTTTTTTTTISLIGEMLRWLAASVCLREWCTVLLYRYCHARLHYINCLLRLSSSSKPA